MNVLVVTNDFPPKVGGVNYYVSELVRRFPPGTATVFASSWPDAGEFDRTFPHRVVRWPTRTLLPTPSVCTEAARLAREVRADVVLCGASLPLAFVGQSVSRRCGIPYVACTHGLELAAAKIAPGRVFLRRLFKHASLVTAVSAWTAARLRPFAPADAQFALLPSGIDQHLFRPDVETASIRHRHNLGEGPIVCCVSRIVARKGQDVLIRAMPTLVGKWPHLRLLIVGSGPYERTLKTLAVRCRVEPHVIFTGEAVYDELPAYFRIGDVFAMPCRSRFAGFETEALGAVYLQAAAVGRPCVGGSAGGAPEAVRHGETGLVVDGTSVSAVVAAVSELLQHPDRATAMGAAGAAWVHRDLTWDHLADTLQQLLSACVNRAAAVRIDSSGP